MNIQLCLLMFHQQAFHPYADVLQWRAQLWSAHSRLPSCLAVIIIYQGWCQIFWNYDSETAQNWDKFTSSFLIRAKLFVPAVCPIFCFERIALFIAAFFCYYVWTCECDVHVTVNNVASFWVFNKVVYLTLFRAPMGDEDRPLLWENPLIINFDYLFISLVAKIFGLYLCLPVLPSFPQGFKHPVFEPWTYLKLGLHLHFGRTWSQ